SRRGGITLLCAFPRTYATPRQRKVNSDELLLAQSGHPRRALQCPLSGVKRTWRLHCEMSAYDPKGTTNHAHDGRLLHVLCLVPQSRNAFSTGPSSRPLVVSAYSARGGCSE